MSEQIPLPAKSDFGLPQVAIDGQALARFTIEMLIQLRDFEERFVQPRQHPRIDFGQARGANRQPR
jgi:hypothetical protein